MRIRTSLAPVALLAFAILAPLAPHAVISDSAQERTAAPDRGKDLTARGLFISKQADAIRVQVLDAATGAPVSPSQEFRKGDLLKVAIESNFQGRVYIINAEKSPSGQRVWLIYPNVAATDNKIRPGAALTLSPGFDEQPATEVLRVIVSHDAIAYLDSALKGNCPRGENRCELNPEAVARMEALMRDTRSSASGSAEGGVYARHPSGRQPQTGLTASGVRSRDIILAPGRDKDANSTYIAIPVSGEAEGRLKSREAFAFEILLKHI